MSEHTAYEVANWSAVNAQQELEKIGVHLHGWKVTVLDSVGVDNHRAPQDVFKHRRDIQVWLYDMLEEGHVAWAPPTFDKVVKQERHVDLGSCYMIGSQWRREKSEVQLVNTAEGSTLKY